MNKAILLLYFFLTCQVFIAQDYFIKNFNEPTGVSQLSAIAAVQDDGIVHATQLNTGEIVIRRINKCGEQIWAKQIGQGTLPMDLVDIKSVGNNFIFAGNLGNSTTGRVPFIFSINVDGSINYYKTINLPAGIESITYSFLVSSTGEFFLYFNYDTSGSGNSSSSVVKLDDQGVVKWFKSYPELANWGRAVVTNDGGLLIRSGAFLTRVNSNGDVLWSKGYQSLGYIDYPVQVNGGFIFFKYPSGSVNNTYNIIKISDSGDIKWVTNNFYNFRPKRGILRKNGNVLFTGNSQGVGLLEVDTSSGSIIQFKKYDPSNTFSITGIDLYEDANSDILISGIDNSGIVNRNLYLRVDSNLNLPTCPPVDLQISVDPPPNVSVFAGNNVTVQTRPNSTLTILNEPFSEQLITNTTLTSHCIFQENRGDYKLGMDTIICPKMNLTLGNATNNFDDYLWSTGEKTKQIIINTAGEYSLRVLTACDTLRDTIFVSIYPNVDLFIGNDTSFCYDDSVTLTSNLSLSNYYWSTGDTTASISIKTEGYYWLETQANCGTVRDSIFVKKIKKRSMLDLGLDKLICPNDSLILGDSLTDFNNFLWSTGETSQFITVKTGGKYSIEASSQCDTIVDELNVLAALNLMPTFLISKKKVKTGEIVKLINTTLNTDLTLWHLGDGQVIKGDSIIKSYTIPGKYNIRMEIVSSDGCYFNTSETILVEPSDYSIPNIFSPNNDGINDQFAPIGNDVINFSIEIYDRWGKNLFSKYNIGWDGRNSEGKRMNNGTYFYKITLEFSYGKIESLTGNVVLTR